MPDWTATELRRFAAEVIDAAALGQQAGLDVWTHQLTEDEHTTVQYMSQSEQQEPPDHSQQQPVPDSQFQSPP